MLFFIIKQEALELLIHHNGLCRQDKHRQGMNVPATVLLYFIQGSMYSCEVSKLVPVTHQLANTHYNVHMYVCTYVCMWLLCNVCICRCHLFIFSEGHMWTLVIVSLASNYLISHVRSNVLSKFIFICAESFAA